MHPFNQKRYLLEPLHELFNRCAESFLGLAVIEHARFVKFGLATMPLDDKLFLEEDLVADNQLHEGRCEFNLLWVALNEEQDYSLQAMLDADLAILADELQEGFLVLFPILDYIASGTKEAA